MPLIGTDIVKNLLHIFTMKSSRLNKYYYNYLKFFISIQFGTQLVENIFKKVVYLIHLWVIFGKNIFATNIDVAFSYIDNVFYHLCKEEQAAYDTKNLTLLALLLPEI